MPPALPHSTDHPRLRVAGLCALALLINVIYALVRPTTEGLFLKQYGHGELPLVWLLVTVGSVLVVALYSRLLGRWGLLRLLAATAAGSAGLLALLLASQRARLPGALHGLYLWKDLHVVILVELFYSYANSVFVLQRARWLYALFGAMASTGGLLGSLAVRGLAQPLGATALLWTSAPLLALLALVGLQMTRLDASEVRGPRDRRASLAGGLAVVQRSPYLLQLLLLVAVVQVVITVVDFDFNAVAERVFHGEDQLSAGIATVYGAISVVTLAMHLLTGPTLRLAGVPLTLVSIPLLLAAAQGLHTALGLFSTVALVKVAGKCFDYSILRAAKELLYIPLGPAERTQGKAVVDMATYRVAKGGAALLLHLGRFGAATSRPLALGLMGLWVALALSIATRFRGRVSREEELHAARS